MNKRRDEVAGMFDAVAKRYDVTNTVLSVGNAQLWRVATTKAIAPKAGERVLDVAAGTGTSAAAYARTGATVVGVDISDGMLQVGRERHPNIEFVQADAEKLPFGDDEFDAVTISFGLRNVEHPKQALAEMYRVLKPGGRVVICEFSTPTIAPVRVGYRAYLRHLLPQIAKRSSSNPQAYQYLGESIEQWPDQETLSQWLRGAGFTRVAHRNLTAGIVALHRGHKAEDAAIRASVERRTRRPSRSKSTKSAAAGTTVTPPTSTEG